MRSEVSSQLESVNFKEEPVRQTRPAGKTFSISKKEVWLAYEKVKANHGAAGVDGQTIEEFEKDLKNNLYRIWNRMTSGSYFPPPVRMVEIPKTSGDGKRTLGIATVADRVAQTVVKNRLEPKVDPHFHADSYGFRPGKSALEAVGVAQERCKRYRWVLDLDIKKFFDTIPHELLMRVVRKHVKHSGEDAKEKWIVLYIERWLKVPSEMEDGTLILRTMGVPQGGPVSPLLANLFMHYAFDEWMRRRHPTLPFERYADDAIVHCKTEKQSVFMWHSIAKRLKECGLELNSAKTKVVFCKDSNRWGTYATQSFDFLGFTFRPRKAKNRAEKRCFTFFSPSISRSASSRIRKTISSWKLHRQTNVTLQELSEKYDSIIRGWLQYYGQYGRRGIHSVMQQIEYALQRWARRKYKKLWNHKRRAVKWLRAIALKQPKLFAHWKCPYRSVCP